MSEAAKSARAAMKEKASRLAKGDPRQKVDASSWTPPEPLDADVKTGLRPISRRAFKKGGKVVGEMAEHHAGRMPRAFANAKVNRNVKDANEEREGKKHVGGMKKGGKAEGGATKYKTFPEQWLNESYTGRAVSKIAEALGAKKGKPKDYDMGVQRPSDVEENVPQPPRRPSELNRGAPQPADTMDSESVRRMNEEASRPGYSRKSGGRTKKMDGGPMGQVGSSDQDYTKAQQRMANLAENIRNPSGQSGASDRAYANAVSQRMANSAPRNRIDQAQDLANSIGGYKKGGRTKKMDGGLMDPRAAAAKRMADASAVAGVPTAVMNFGGIKKGALSPLRGMKKGGATEFEGSAKDIREDKKLAKKHGMSMKEWERSKMDEKHDKQRSMKGLKSGGECALDGEMQGTRPTGGRKARKSGGRAKGKTNINIVIAQKPDQGAAMPLPPMPPPPLGAPVPVPAPAIGAPPPMPIPAAPPMPAGAPPMMRKAGGRTYPKMHYGAGSGLGRLEKIEEYGLSQR